MKAEPLRARMVDVLNGWLTREGFAPLDAAHVLDAPDLDHAVARGAAYYGLARASGRGVRIRSGARAQYYIGIESALPAVPGFPAPLKALCVVPFGMEEGTSAPIAGREFGLVGRRAGGVPLSQLDDPQRRCAGNHHRGLGRRPRRARSARGDAEAGRTGPLGRRWDRPRSRSRAASLRSARSSCGASERDGAHRWKLELNIREGRSA